MITFLDFFSPLAVPANCRSSQCHTHVVESSDHRPFYIVTEDEKCCPNQKYVVKSEIYKGVLCSITSESLDESHAWFYTFSDADQVRRGLSFQVLIKLFVSCRQEDVRWPRQIIVTLNECLETAKEA